MRNFAVALAIIVIGMVQAEAQEPAPACMDYLAADKAHAEDAAKVLAAYEEAVAPSREAAQRIRQQASLDYRKAEEAASTKYRNAQALAAATLFENEMKVENLYIQALQNTNLVYESSVAPYRKALEEATVLLKSNPDDGFGPRSKAKRRAEQRLRDAERRFGDARKRSMNRAENAFEQDITNMNVIYEKTIEPLDAIYIAALAHAGRLREEASNRADATSQVAQEQADSAYQTAIQAIETQLVEAYLDAFRYPQDGWERDLEGYDNDIVLRLAVAEREVYCPAWQ